MFILILIGLAGRIAYIYVVFGDEYERRAVRQQVYDNHVDRVIMPNRGSILDRNGQFMAVSHTVYNIFIDVRFLAAASEAEINRTLYALESVLDIDPARIKSYMAINPETDRPNRDTHYLIIARQVDITTEARLRQFNLHHVHSESDTKRTYPAGAIAANLLGFLAGDGNHWGLEGTYNHYLLGRTGRQVRMFNEGGFAATQEFPAVTGYTLVTSLDIPLQQSVAEIARRYGSAYGAQSTQVIIMNPFTGEILAMSQYPSFNNNSPMDISEINSFPLRQKMENLADGERLNSFFSLWSNAGINRSFEPGSIFKPIVAAIALEEGLTFPGEVFHCPGFLMIGAQRINCWNRTGNGSLTLEQAMAASCNVVSMELAGRIERDVLYEYLRDFGLGQPTGIDLIGEAHVLSLTYTRAQLNPVEVATTSFGQGFNMTGIQAITSFAAVINGGDLVRPHIVSRVLDGDTVIFENRPTVRRNIISAANSDFWRETMVDTIEWSRGTGRAARIEGFSIGGKTGTAQQLDREGDELVYSFIGYLPADNPRYIVLVVIDRPNLPVDMTPSIHIMLRDVLEEIIRQRGILPQDAEILPENSIVYVEDYLGDFTQALRRIAVKGLVPEPIGRGDTVVNQVPLPGSAVAPGTRIILYLSEEGDDLDWVALPNLQNISLDLAREILAEINLNYIVREINPEEERGDEAFTVINQLPQPGIRLPLGTEVTLLVE